MRRGRPGIAGTMARTAAIAGTATVTSAVVGGAMQSSASKKQAAAQQQAAAAQEQAAAEAAAAAPVEAEVSNDEILEKLKMLPQLRDAGVLSQEEFDAQRAELLGQLGIA